VHTYICFTYTSHTPNRSTVVRYVYARENVCVCVCTPTFHLHLLHTTHLDNRAIRQSFFEGGKGGPRFNIVRGNAVGISIAHHFQERVVHSKICHYLFKNVPALGAGRGWRQASASCRRHIERAWRARWFHRGLAVPSSAHVEQFRDPSTWMTKREKGCSEDLLVDAGEARR